MRYQQVFPANRSDQEAQNVIAQYLSQEGFTSTQYKGEAVWKKGMGFFAGPQYIKAYCQNGQVHLEAWMRVALFPGVYVGEMGMNGIVGGLPKKVLRDRVKMLTQLLQG